MPFKEIPESVIGWAEFPQPKASRYETEKLMDRICRDIQDTCKKFETSHEQLETIKATLIINCRSDQALGKLGLEYKEKYSVENNLIYFLEKLVFRIQELEKEQKNDLK